MAWSKTVITFARPGDVAVFDSIPLAEVESVQQIDESEHEPSGPSLSALPNVVSSFKNRQSTIDNKLGQ